MDQVESCGEEWDGREGGKGEEGWRPEAWGFPNEAVVQAG